MPADISEVLARRLELSRDRVVPICELLGSGLCPSFIAHYRKAAAAGVDEAALWRLASLRKELLFTEDLRTKARRQAELAKALSDDLAKAIAAAEQPEEIEDLVRPYKPRRRTAALVAQERGLGPLADYASSPPADGPDLPIKAVEFVSAAKEVRSVEEALAGASHILAERVAENPRLRKAVRALIYDKGILKSSQAKEGGKGAAEFRGYFQFQEAVNRLPPHRVLAVNRGERSKALKVVIEVPPEALKEKIFPIIIPAGHRFAALLEAVVTDALSRLVLPTVDREVRRQLTLRAESHAIEVFAANLRSLLMARPIRGRRMMAIQPGFRTGCKVVSLDDRGVLLGETIIYPLEPQKKWPEGKAALLTEIQKHGIQLVAIGNGTGCREVEQLVSETIEEAHLDLQYAILSEAGAAVYADSDLAKQEFPKLDAAILATISIGRRMIDPLDELVKIDPRAIGVGLYQHDVNQGHLTAALQETMESCVAAIGVDLSAASPAMLRYIPGLGQAQVDALVARRAQSPLATREELRSLPGWDDRTFQTAAGFLRIRGTNPLDATRIHPESYAAAERILAHFGCTAADLASAEKAQTLRQQLTGLSLEPLAEKLQIPLVELVDLVGALQNPDHDPREQNHGPVFRKKIRRIEDLAPGMWVKGTVRNVVDFGAFVDIGLKEDGLIHISQFSRRYVRNPLKFLHVGDVVDVRIVSIEADKHRIALTLIAEEPKKGESKPGENPAEGAAAPAPGAAPASQRPPRPRTAQPRTGRPAEGAAKHGQRTPPRTPGPASTQSAPRTGGKPGAPASAAHRPSSPPGGNRTGGRTSERPPRSGDRKFDRGKRPPRPEHYGPPRVIISKPNAKPDVRPPDEKGRPKLRWAIYESDGDEDVTIRHDEPAAPSKPKPVEAEVAPEPAPEAAPPPPPAPAADAPPASEPPAAPQQ
jgi:protein Tex